MICSDVDEAHVIQSGTVFYSLSQKRPRFTSTLNPSPYCVYASAHGWVLLVDLDFENEFPEGHVIKLVKVSNLETYQLPLLSPLQQPPSVARHVLDDGMDDQFAICGSPNTPDFMVAFFYYTLLGGRGILVRKTTIVKVWRPGQNEWIDINSGHLFTHVSLVDSTIYRVINIQWFGSCDINNADVSFIPLGSRLFNTVQVEAGRVSPDQLSPYLVGIRGSLHSIQFGPYFEPGDLEHGDPIGHQKPAFVMIFRFDPNPNGVGTWSDAHCGRDPNIRRMSIFIEGSHCVAFPRPGEVLAGETSPLVFYFNGNVMTIYSLDRRSHCITFDPTDHFPYPPGMQRARFVSP